MKTYMLTPSQRQYYDYWKMNPNDDSLIIEPAIMLNDDTDVETLVAEAERLIDQLLILHARVVETDGEPRLYFDPQVKPQVEVMYVSDDEAEQILDHRHDFYDMNRGPLAHFVVLVTPTRKFFRSSISNMLCDGWSISQITNCIPIGTQHHWTSISEKQNSYPRYLEQMEELRQSPRFERDREWWIAYMKGVDRLTDFAVKDEYEAGRLIKKRRTFDKHTIDDVCKSHATSVAEVLLTAWGMALRDMTLTTEPCATVSFVTLTRGRTKLHLNVLGNFLVEKALRIDIDAEDKPADVRAKVRHANFTTQLHSLFTEQDMEPYIGNSDRGTCVIFNEGMDHSESVVDGCIPEVRYPNPTETCEFLLGIMWGHNDRYDLEVSYSEPLYLEADVERFVERFEHWFNEILK